MVTNSDPTEAKLDVEHRLQVEEDSVAWLAEKIKQSADLTTTMTGVLTSFEERLTKLEATILPVYQETENLQRRQENIDKTLDALGDVINFYNVSKEVEATVKGLFIYFFFCKIGIFIFCIIFSWTFIFK